MKKNTSMVSDDLVAAYAATVFEIDCPGEAAIQFKVDVFCPRVEALLRHMNASEAAFITAYNPGSVSLCEAENAASQEKLLNDLNFQGLQFFRGRGIDPTGAWKPEPSVLVFAITRDNAHALAKKYGQNAFVYLACGAAPELVLLR